MKKVAVILAGCGYLDGSEIRESVLSLLALDLENIKYEIFALDEKQYHVVDHVLSEVSSLEPRNILEEAGRIARGKVTSIDKLNSQEFDGLIIPGGFGVAKNLSDFAFKGSKSSLNPKITSILKDFRQDKKPIGAICIAPVLLALTFGDLKPVITLGSDKNIAEEIEKTGAIHQECLIENCVVDSNNCFVTTPAYMYDQAGLKDILLGITSLVKEMKKLG